MASNTLTTRVQRTQSLCTFYLPCLRLYIYWWVKLICQLPCMHQTAPPTSSWVQTMQCKSRLIIQPSCHDTTCYKSQWEQQPLVSTEHRSLCSCDLQGLQLYLYWWVKLICQLPYMHQTAPPNSSWVQTMQCKCQLMIQPSFHDNSSPQTPVCQNPTEQISNINPTRDMHLQWTSSFCLLTYYVCTCTWWITHSSDHIFPQTARCLPSTCPHHTHQHSAPSPGALASARPANRQLRPTAVMPEPPR